MTPAARGPQPCSHSTCSRGPSARAAIPARPRLPYACALTPSTAGIVTAGIVNRRRQNRGGTPDQGSAFERGPQEPPVLLEFLDDAGQEVDRVLVVLRLA